MPIDLPRERNAETREMVQYFRHVTEIREALRGEEGHGGPSDDEVQRIAAEGPSG